MLLSLLTHLWLMVISFIPSALAFDDVDAGAPPGAGGDAAIPWILGGGAEGPGATTMWAKICDGIICNANIFSYPWDAARVVLTFIFSLIAGIAVCVLIFAGIRLASSQGNEEATGSAKKMLFFALFGLAIAGIAIPVINLAISIITAAT
jgi:hypothetical protein